jgi:hypothetical protein
MLSRFVVRVPRVPQRFKLAGELSPERVDHLCINFNGKWQMRVKLSARRPGLVRDHVTTEN